MAHFADPPVRFDRSSVRVVLPVDTSENGARFSPTASGFPRHFP